MLFHFLPHILYFSFHGSVPPKVCFEYQHTNIKKASLPFRYSLLSFHQLPCTDLDLRITPPQAHPDVSEQLIPFVTAITINSNLNARLITSNPSRKNGIRRICAQKAIPSQSAAEIGPSWRRSRPWCVDRRLSGPSDGAY